MSGIAIILVLFLLVGFLSAGRSKRRRAAAGKSMRTAKATAPPRISIATTIHRQNPMPSSMKPVFSWQPPGRSPVVLGHTILDGMVYIGQTTPYQSDGNGCVIDPSLPVSAPTQGSGVDKLGYWPSYKGISAASRGIYLDWLSSGKSTPDIDIGYVFLYFYGLERRLLIDRPPPDEEALLIDEVARLRSIYSGNGSFDGYSRRLIETIETARAIRDPASALPFKPDLSLPVGNMSLPLKIAIARKVIADEPLGFELAAAGLLGLPWDVAQRNTLVVDRTRSIFLRTLRARFEKTFPAGFRLRNRKDSNLRLDYHPASAGLRVDLGAATLEHLPDPATLTWTKLVGLANQVSSELEPYAKVLAYHPERANSLAAIPVCPADLASSTAIEARTWLDGLSPPIATVPFKELARHAIGATAVKWTLRHHRLIAEALSNMGRGMEPDPADGSERLEDATEVLIISDPTCLTLKSPAFGIAAAAAVLVAGMARAHDGAADTIEETWLDLIQRRLNLPSGESLRLRARLHWLRRSSAGLAKAKQMLTGATAADRETAAWSAAVAAAAGGMVDKAQIALLEAIYDKLEVPRRSLYTTIHSVAAMSAIPASEPVTVMADAPDAAHPIPRPPQITKPGLDEDRLQQVRQETERVSSVLADIFLEEQEAAPSQPANEAAASDPLPGLDAAHAALVTALMTNPSWARVDFEAAARAAGLMPDGSLEAINEWAFDHFDEPFIEDTEPMIVNVSLLGPMLERANAA